MEKKKKDEEDYGDYVTRCICELEHDDGYMIACDECGVWQHIECMQVDPKHLPDNYLCERCEPRSIDRRRARQIQLKKRGALSEMENSRRRRDIEGRSSSSSLLSPIPLSSRKKRKKGKIPEPVKMDSLKRTRKDTPSVPASTKKPKKRIGSKPQPRSRLNSSTGSIQSLLNAATLLEQGDGREGKPSGLWNTNYSPWSDEYETLAENTVSDSLGRLLSSGDQLSQLKSEAVVYSSVQYQEVCRSVDAESAFSLVEVARRRKGVVADVSIPEDELVTEYKGLVTLKADVLSELSVKSLWRESPCPFVYQYDKMADLEVVLDAREGGSIARFIRRSCSPNTEVRHFFVEDSLHFGVYALGDLSPQEEITLAFDFQHDKCDYPIECACGQVKSACLIATTTPLKGVGVPKSCDIEEPSSVRVRQRSYSHLLDEDSNSSWTSTASQSRKRRSTRVTPLSPKATPLSPKLSRPASREESSDSEGEGGKRRKSLTREERKTEQVWKMFEKMEASAQRKRQHLVSEGSADSAELLTSPLLTRHAHTGRDRRTPSTGSRRAHLLTSSGKLRLSSVSSSGDPLSPTFDLPELFSPPTTPAHTAHMFTPPLPTHYTPSVNVTPYLNPKYLLQDLVLPWKKAFLRKWECEKLGEGEFPDRYSYWAGSDTPTHYGDIMRERVRGSLKHRWLMQYSEGPDKENMMIPLLSLPGKKQFLRRWEEETVPMATNIADNLDTQQDDSMEGVASGRGSPLFDEFSDGEEFELPTGERRRRTSHTRVKDMELKERSMSPPTPSHSPHTPPTHESPPTQSPLEEMEAIDDEETTSPLLPQDHVSLCSDISEDSISQTGPKTPQETTPTSPMSPVGPLTPPTLQQSTPDFLSPAIQHVNISDISSDMDGSIGQSAEFEVTKSRPQTPPPHTSTEAQPERQTSESSDVEWARGEVEGAKETLAHTPIKRKINLSEYRNRIRKPADKKSSLEATPTPPSHITPSTHYPTQPVAMVTALPHGVATGMNLSPIAMTTCVPMTTMAPGIAMPTVSGLPQFEPVSPDDSDHTPPLGTMEGPGSGGGQPSQMMMVGPLMGGHLMPPITTQPTSLVEVGGPLLMSGYNQQPLHAQPQVVWPVEACNDPRRVSLGERGFVEPHPPSHMTHPHYGMGGMGFPRPPHPPHGQYMPRPPRPPGGGGYY